MLTRNSYPVPITEIKSLAVICNPSGDYAIAAGQTFELRVTVSNQGNHSAIINICLDETSQPLWQWCKISTQHVALEPNQSSELIFTIPIPLDTPPGIYSYLLIVDASQHYPEENPIQHQAKLQILPPIQSVVRVNDPTFNLLPPSSSQEPLVVPRGATLEIEAVVFNRSHRVDRFRISAIDLPRSWWTVIYPEGIRELGLVVETDNLALNPQESATIKLQIHPPLTAKASQYSSTIQLKSINFPDLVLLDIIYFQIAPINIVDLELQTILGKVKLSTGKFAILLHNQGNTLREISFTVRENREVHWCEYTLAQERIKLPPHTSQTLNLSVQPKQWWRRPWFGRGLPMEFQIDLEDLYQLPLSRKQLPGILVWEARPWWHLVLLLISATGSIAALILAIWWLFFKPPTPPKILNFAAESSVYQASNQDFIRLNWKIDRPKQIKDLKLVGRSPDRKVTSQPFIYDFSQGIPENLADFCTLERILNCRNVITDARQAGDYVFELTLRSRNPKQADSILATNTITIQPLPTPQITQFQATLAESANTSFATTRNSNHNLVYLDFAVSNSEQLNTIKLTGFDYNNVINFPTQKYDVDRGLIAELGPYCQTKSKTLICQKIPLSITNPGEYIFQLAAIKSTDAGQIDIVDTQKSTLIAIASPEPPKLANFISSQPIYQEEAYSPILLNWDILQPKQLAAIKLISRSPEGITNTRLMTYDFSQGIPPELDNYCYITDIISCRNIPTQAQQAGDYIFELMSVTKANPKLIDSTITSDLIRIEPIPLPSPAPAPLEIITFQINGIEAPPKYIAKINPEDANSEVTISWNVLSDPTATIELLPAPGKVEPTGQLSYPLAHQATTETLTLKVTDKTGRQIERSLIIETVISEKTNDPKSKSDRHIPESDRQKDIFTPTDLPPELK